jgi:hypothetical protein
MTDPSRDFSRGVHDYYAHYADNADAKIGAIFGLNFAVAGLLIANLPDGCLPAVFSWQAVGLDAVAGGVLLYGIYPRTPSPKGKESSPIFWEDVAGESSASEYAARVEGLTAGQIDRAYALNNYVVARILHTKFWAIRIAIWFTVAALASTIASVIAR